MYVLIPKSNEGNQIAPGSGIVTKEISGARISKVYYEGNLYGASNLVTWNDRVINAAGRCHQSYPTTALTFMKAEELAERFEVVGTVDCDDWLVTVDQNKIDLVASYASGELGNLLGKDLPCEATILVNGSYFRRINTFDFEKAVRIGFNIVKKHFSRGSMVDIKGSGGMQTHFMIP